MLSWVLEQQTHLKYSEDYPNYWKNDLTTSRSETTTLRLRLHVALILIV